MDAQLAETNLVAPQKQQSEDEEETFKTAAGSVVIAWLCPSRIGSGTFVVIWSLTEMLKRKLALAHMSTLLT